MGGHLILTVGLPGSGKTTLARGWARSAPDRIVTVSRDDIRSMVFNQYGIVKDEGLVSRLEETQVKELLKAGLVVIVHDMNLRSKYRKRWFEIATKCGATFELHDLTDVPLSVCLERNGLRPKQELVPEKVIIDNYNKFIKGKTLETYEDTPVKASEIYSPDFTKPRAIIVDVDGTVALHGDVRDPYDTSKYHLDKPNQPVINLVRREHYDSDVQIVFTTGRHEDFREVTRKWLTDNVGVPFTLIMRENKNTEDSDEKLMLFDNYIRDHFWVNYCLDDRDRVVRAWRSIGLTCLQVAEGDF